MDIPKVRIVSKWLNWLILVDQAIEAPRTNAKKSRLKDGYVFSTYI
jgi:hypothetical protein